MSDQSPSADVWETLRKAYAAFNARDIEVVLSLMHQDVEWPNGMEGGYVYGHEGVRAYRTRQWDLIDPIIEPRAFVPSRTDVSWSRFASVYSTRTVVRSRTGKCGTSTASETDSCGTWRYATLALAVKTGSQRYVPEQRFLAPEEVPGSAELRRISLPRTPVNKGRS
jgi:hypothetical protein